jgi:hypothetical protein
LSKGCQYLPVEQFLESGYGLGTCDQADRIHHSHEHVSSFFIMFPYLSFLSRAPFFETAHDSVGAGLIWLPWFVRFCSVYLVPSPTESRHSGLAGAGLGSLARASPGVPSHLIHGSDPRSSAVSWYVMVLTLTRSETWGGNWMASIYPMAIAMKSRAS